MKRRDFLTCVLMTGVAATWRRTAAMTLGDNAFAGVNRDIVLNHIRPGHAAFAEAARKLEGAVSSLGDGETGLAAARGAFHEAMNAWMAVQHLRLGPSQADGRSFRIQFWPDSRNRLGRQLGVLLAEKRRDIVDDPSVMANASVALQGLPAIERLLYETGLSPEGYAVRLARAIAANLEAMAAELAAAWAPGGGWSEGLYAPGGGVKDYATASQATGALVLAMTTQLEFVVNKKLYAPLGSNADRPRPHLAESWRSSRSLRNVRQNIAALINLFEHGDGRLRSLVENAGSGSAAETISSALRSGLEIVETLPESFGDGLSDGEFRSRVISVIDELGLARAVLTSEAAPALGLLLGFNSLDGD